MSLDGFITWPNESLKEPFGDGALDVTVSSLYPLAESQAAHEQIEDGHTRGKRVLRMAY